MKRRTRLLVVASVLAVAGACWFLAQRPSKIAAPNPSGAAEVAVATNTAVASAGTGGGTAATIAKFPTLNTNKLAYRLSNTTNTIRQLEKNPHALLLANAFIDTDKPLDLKIPAHLRAWGDPGAYIVQARGPMDVAFRAALGAAHASIVSYIPNNAYLVRVNAAGAGQLSGNAAVQAVVPYDPYYKMQSSLLGLAVNQQVLPPGTALTLGLFGADAATAEAEIAKLGAPILGRDKSPFGPVVKVLAPTDWLALAQSKVVQFVEPAFTRQAANDLSRVTLGIAVDTQAPTNYFNLYGSNVWVAVNDSGIDADHPDFSIGGNAAAPGTSPPSRVKGLTLFDLVDTNGHGTHVAGIIAGNGSASFTPPYTNVGMYAQGSIPFADFRGKAPLANLFSVNDGGYSDYQLQTNASLAGALISNNSWDYGNGDSAYDLAAASYDFATRDAIPGTNGSQPVLFVFAAGNDGGGNDDGAGGSGDTILSPGTAKNVITVGAVEQLRFITNIVTTITAGTGTNAPTTNQVAYWQAQTDSGDQVAWYSSRGNVGIGTEGNNGRFKPDVLAPGTMVVSTSSQFNHEWDTNAYYNRTNFLGTTYTYQVADTNALVYYNVQVPPNAVAVDISIYPNRLSPLPFPTNLLIYAKQSIFPTTTSYDILTANNQLDIPPTSGGAISGIQAIQGNGFAFAVGVPTNETVNYNLSVTIMVTNDVGDLYSVLEGMNDGLGGYYRYESGTSMAAAGVSGVLALIQDYFTNQFTPSLRPSPALMKAVLINGARSVADYGIAFTNGINFQGWGMNNIQNSVPAGGLFNKADGSTTGSSFFVEQNPSTALATGDSHTYVLTVNTNDFGNYLPLQATLVWTDPPGDPAAAIKLVNNLDLIITNLDTGDVYFGNDISPDIGYNLAWDTNNPANLDTINNVESVLLPPLLAGSYSVTVVGRSVNVNAVTAQTNNFQGQYAPNIVQDYALVLSIGEGEVTNAFTIKDGGVVSNPTGAQNFTVITTTNAPLMNQLVGASSPLLGTNTLALGTKTMWGPNGVVTIGMTNQWHFYVVTNTGLKPDYTNAAFLTFAVSTLSIPRMGVYEDTMENATKPEANLDLFVSEDGTITNLNPEVLSNCLAGVGNNRAALANQGTQFVFYTNSVPGQSVYYIGIQSEDQMASEYSFLPVFTDVPFSSLDQNGNQIVNGLMLPMPIPPGNNAHPGVTNVFALAIMPMEVEKVTVTNLDEHQNFGDLFGTLSFSGQKVVLNNHDGFGNTFGHRPIVYDDTPEANRPVGTTNSDGPGSLLDFRAKSALGPWILSVLDNSAGGFTGQVSKLTLVIQPHRNLKQPGVIVAVPPGGWFIDWVDVPAGYTNLTFYGTNVTQPGAAAPPIQMYERYGNDPTLIAYDQEATLTNGNPPGNIISVGPPLAQGRYFIGLYNPNTSISQNVFLSVTLGVNSSVNDVFNYNSGSSQPLTDDSVTPVPAPTQGQTPNPATVGSTIIVPPGVTNLVAQVNVGMVVNSPRISDYTFTLVSPIGQRVLLMENRGAGDTNGAGLTFVYTNVLNSIASGGAAANTNYLAVDPLGGTVPITWEFYNVQDQMTIYDTTNPAYFNTNGAYLLYNTGFASNGPAGGPYIDTTINIPYGPGISNITIIMNQFGNPFAGGGDAWRYTAGAPITNYEYLVFTDDTNLATVPIKFAQPPFSFNESNTNYALSDLDVAAATNYFGPTNIYDPFGGWTVPTNLVVVSTMQTNGQFVLVTNVVSLTNNLVSVVTDPSVALTGDAGGSNYLALADGTITRTIPTAPGRIYNVTFWYRGPGIAGWWRGEGNGNDSSDPEKNDNNGTLIGRFNFPAGEVSQAFGFQDPGNTYQFAGTNTYVQVPASPSLNVGAGGGFTVEGWINPTNLVRPQPLVEWLAHTNLVDTNITVVQGPVLDQATGHFYFLLGSTNRIRSEFWAQQLGGHLVTLETANENQWVYDTFTGYGTQNRDLWTGLRIVSGTNQWVGSVTNFVAYTNWAPGQPAVASGDPFAFIEGPTNAYPGLWSLAGDNREIGGIAPTNPIYGVVEVNTIATNGVQFWISGTNWTPGETNVLQGCLYANIIDTNYGSHEIFSAPGLLATDVFQHVALTYNTNSGIAALYLNGTNVATTNLGVFVPKTDGDLLIGLDMSRYTNNFYGGEMDEMSIYGRAMSLAEISAIYHVSADTTNRLIGKFDPAITPAVGLAEAVVRFGSSSNTIFGVNNQWEVNSFTFTAVTNSMPLTISGIAPGILLDSFSVQEAPQTNLYYFPEQPLASLNGTPAAGNWTLQVWDNRVGAYVPTSDQLVNWQLSFVLVSNSVIAATLPPETPVTTTVPAGQTVYYAVPVPAWAHEATNILVSSTLPVDLFYYTPANPPTTATGPNLTLLTGQTSGVGSPVLALNPVPPQAQLFPGTYYLGVRNNGTRSATVNLEVDFDIYGLTNGVPFTDVLTNEYSAVRYFSFDISSNAYEATFQLLQLTGNADLVVRKGPPLPDFSNDEYGSFNNSNADENIYVLTNSTPVPLSAGRWYLGAFNRDGSPVHYSVLAKELDLNNLNLPTGIVPAIINLTNGVPFAWTAGPGAALTNFFRFQVTNSIVSGTNVFVHGLRFELFNLSGNGDLTLQSNALPLAPPFFQSSQNGGTSPELIFLFTNSVLTNLAADWYLGVPNHDVTNINYTVIAEVMTNLYFPAFPGAEGAGGGALGGRFGDVYHVITTADSGPGSLRDAVTSARTNRTVVFDISGTVFLTNSLVITNSYLTIAGETAPGGGITVAGQVTSIQSAHDVIIRDIRFRTEGLLSGQTNNFEGLAPADYLAGQAVKGWTVLSNQTSVVTDPTNAYPGHRNFLALANGVVSNNLPTTPGRTYSLSLPYRGPGIAGWWRGESNYHDSMGANNGTTVNGGPGFGPGQVGPTFNFNGINQYLLVTVTNSALDVGAHGSGMSFEAWIEPTSLGAEELLFEYEAPLGTSDGFNNSSVNFSIPAGSPYLQSNLRDVSTRGSHVIASPTGLLHAGVWQHIALTYDQASGMAALYINGANVTTASIGSFTLWTSLTNIVIGARTTYFSVLSPGVAFPGGMDEISFYGRALSHSEVKAIYANGSAGKFDPAVFNTAPDKSLAEAALSIPGVTNIVLLGNNTNWQTQTVTFTATGTSVPVVVRGVEPGMLIDSLSVPGIADLAGALQFNAVSNVIADHVSTSWSTNADLGVLLSTNVTVQWSIMADSLYSSNDLQGTGSLLRYGSGTLSFHHNLYADNFSGSPRSGDNLTLDFVNNVIYNWGMFSGLSGGANDFDFSVNGCTNQLNYVCNYLIAGPDTALFATNYAITNIAFFGGLTNANAANWIFQTNNFIDSDTNGILNGSDTGWGMFTNDYTRFARGFPTPPVSVDEAYKAYERVLDFAGVNMALRDAVDTNIVTKVRAQTGRLINSAGLLPILNSTLPYLDTDQDGVPDFWETTFTPSLLYIPSNNHDRDGNGYTDLEEYNNWLAGPHALTVTNAPVGVDLYQLCGESGHLAFFVTNGVHGSVYLTNILGSVTNFSPIWSNTIAIFTPTNSASGGTNYYGYGSFDCYVTNLDTAAYFGPVTVSVIVSGVPITINSNMPPVIVPLVSGVSDPTNYGGSQFYSIQVTTNDYGALFEIDDPTGPMAMVVSSSQQYPSLSSYDYYTNLPAAPANLQIAVFTNTMPVPLAPGTWYMAAINESGSNVVYTAKITLLQKLYAPLFLFPTNTTIFTNIETTPLTINCVGKDTNTPPLPLSFALINGPTNLTVSTAGVINWTPTEAQGPSTNSIAVSVSNGAFSITNAFIIIVEESNLPPVLPFIPNQIVIVPGTLIVTNTATDPDIPTNALGYTLTSTVSGTNPPVIDTNGIITWAPTAGQIGTNYLLTTVVTDTNPWAVNTQSLLTTNSFYVSVLPSLPPGTPETNIVGPNSIEWFVVMVPTNAIFATNTLVFATLPVNLWFSTNVPQSITNFADRELLHNVNNGVYVLSTNLATAPTNLVPGGVYFLGVQNTSLVSVTNVLRIDFGYATPPGLSLPAIPYQVVIAGETLVVTNTATDTNANAVLNYALINRPAGAAISANGIITWPTTTNIAPTIVLFTTVVTDATDNLKATNNFNVIVLPGLVIDQPQTNIVGPNGINWFVVKVPVNADIATNSLLFATAPVNLWFSTNVPPSINNAADAELLTNSTGGLHIINTMAAPRLVPGSRYYLGVQNNNSFTVTNAVKVTFDLISPNFSIFSITHTNIAGANGFLITWFAPTNDQFHLQWTPALVPANWSNFNGVISAASASATNGQFQYFDDGSQTGGFGATRFYRLLLLNSPTNTSPFFTNTPAVLYANPSTPFVFADPAKDWDIPPQSLAYSVSNSLAGTNVLTVDAGTGLVAWTPTVLQLGLTNLVTVTVTDNGVPPKSATSSFAVVVSTNSPAPSFGSITIGANGVKFQWTASASDQFQIRWTTNLVSPNWQVFPSIITSTTSNFSFVDTNAPLLLLKFYQLILMP